MSPGVIEDGFREAMANFLRNVRERSGMSQESLAIQMAKDQPWVSKTELGARRIQIEDLLSWLDALGIDLAEVADELGEIWCRYRS